MRNLTEYPVTIDEVVELLTSVRERLELDGSAERDEAPVGDPSGAILDEAIRLAKLGAETEGGLALAGELAMLAGKKGGGGGGVPQ